MVFIRASQEKVDNSKTPKFAEEYQGFSTPWVNFVDFKGEITLNSSNPLIF